MHLNPFFSSNLFTAQTNLTAMFVSAGGNYYGLCFIWMETKQKSIKTVKIIMRNAIFIKITKYIILLRTNIEIIIIIASFVFITSFMSEPIWFIVIEQQNAFYSPSKQFPIIKILSLHYVPS